MATWPLAMLVAAAANGHTLRRSCPGDPPRFGGVPWWAMSMPAMSMSAMSMSDMSSFIVCVAWEAAAGAAPVQIISPPGPGMNPAGISA